MCKYSYITGQEAEDESTEKDYFEYKCQCALDGDSGFCGTVFGTKIMEDKSYHISELLKNN